MNEILRDILLEEERVPSTNELAKLYAINPATNILVGGLAVISLACFAGTWGFVRRQQVVS